MEDIPVEEVVMRLVQEHDVYRQLEALIEDVPSLVGVLQEAAEMKREQETVLDVLRRALSEKERMQLAYEKRSRANAARDYISMPMQELSRVRTTEASIEKWHRAVEMLERYNDEASIPELRWFINAAAIKALVGGRATEIKKYLETRKVELEKHHKKHGLRPSINHGRSNIKERLLGEYATPCAANPR